MVHNDFVGGLRITAIAVPETVWMMLLLWIGLLALSFKGNMYGAVGSIIGMMFGILMIPLVGVWLGLILIFLNIYILYKSIWEEHP